MASCAGPLSRPWWALAALALGCESLTSGIDLADAPSAQPTGAAAPAAPTGDGNQAPPSAAPTATLTVVGRVLWPDAGDADHFVSAWPGTRVGVRFFGTALTATMADTDIAPLPAPSGGWAGLSNMWDVMVDGVAQPAFVVAGRAPTEVTLASDLMPGDHEVWITRRTEAPRLGRVAFFGVAAPDGVLLAPPSPRPRRIEVVGTSVETGLHAGVSAADANERQVPTCPFYPQALNQNRAWPKLAAEAVEAELVNTSLEGAGLILGYTNYAGTGVELPGIYMRADVFVPTPTWTDSAPADVVWLAAGWSDAALLDPNDSLTAARLGAAYVGLLAEVRARQAAALIYAVVRTSDAPYFHRDSMAAVIAAAVASRQAAGDARVVVLTLPPWSHALANCDDHPNWAQHQALADAARQRLASDLGW